MAPGFLNTATTGNACKVLKNGSCTCDRAFGIRRPPGEEDDMKNDGKKSSKRKQEYVQPPLTVEKLAILEKLLGIPANHIHQLSDNIKEGEGVIGNIIVIDEASMLSCSKLSCIDQRGKQVSKKVYLPFGGMSVILIMDDHQLPAVGGEVLCEGALKSMLSYELNRPVYGSPTSEGRELYKKFKLRNITIFNRAEDLKLQDMLYQIRNLDKEYPIDDAWLSNLKEITAETILSDTRFIDATMAVPGNRERRSLLIMNIEAKARKEKGKVLMFRKTIQGEMENFVNSKNIVINRFYQDPRYKEELYQFFYPGAKAILQCNLSTSRGISNGQACTMVALAYDKEEYQTKYQDALNDNSEDIFIEVPVPKYVIMEVGRIIGESWENSLSLIQGRFVFAIPLNCKGCKARHFMYTPMETQIPLRVRYKQFEYELGSAATVHKIQGETLTTFLPQLNENPEHRLRLDLESLNVLISRVKFLKDIRLLPLKNGRSSLNYLKNLKSNPYLRVLRHCYDQHGNWIGTREIIESRFDEYGIQWREKVKGKKKNSLENSIQSNTTMSCSVTKSRKKKTSTMIVTPLQIPRPITKFANGTGAVPVPSLEPISLNLKDITGIGGNGILSLKFESRDLIVASINSILSNDNWSFDVRKDELKSLLTSTQGVLSFALQLDHSSWYTTVQSSGYCFYLTEATTGMKALGHLPISSPPLSLPQNLDLFRQFYEVEYMKMLGTEKENTLKQQLVEYESYVQVEYPMLLEEYNAKVLAMSHKDSSVNKKSSKKRKATIETIFIDHGKNDTISKPVKPTPCILKCVQEMITKANAGENRLSIQFWGGAGNIRRFPLSAGWTSNSNIMHFGASYWTPPDRSADRLWYRPGLNDKYLVWSGYCTYPMPHEGNCKSVGGDSVEKLPIGNFIDAIFNDEVMTCHWVFSSNHYYKATGLHNNNLRTWLCEAIDDVVLQILSSTFMTL